MKIEVPDSHPRAKSIRVRENLIEKCHQNVVAQAGLIAHGRGEAFDYLLGEITIPPAQESIRAAAAAFLLAKHPVLSVNGNVAALCPKEIVLLSQTIPAKLEINLFYRSQKRIKAIAKELKMAGASEILGIEKKYSTQLKNLESHRRIVDKRGIEIADLVFVPLEDGDRTEALINNGKEVITVDLNPLSRTAQKSHITIVDNIIRCVPLFINEINLLKKSDMKTLKSIKTDFDNKKSIAKVLLHITQQLSRMAEES
ncbi:MAG: phosphopantothenate/pantothenate synthetase [Spirochaetales bacterium]|nr:phosphopantothenate/pantothenate synthetase [Spirochaetales bacterium]